LMRVNHTGEICAQALYQSQALFARQDETRLALQQAAKEEWDHLGWCAQRLNELGDRPSFLNPVWYAGSFLMGAASALAGDRWNMAFLVETERQVESHLNSHMASLPHEDLRSRAIVETMREEEAAHAQMAESRGAAVMPDPLKYAMRATARLMTTTAYWI
jgi:3-demethoxyubiquinol 3-hydroxylase